jgi:hypothetical protein
VVAGGGLLGVWRWDGGSSARSRGQWRALARHVEKLAGRRWGGSGLHSGGRGSCTAPAAGEAERGAERRQGRRKEGRGPRDSFGKPENQGTSL